MVKNVFDHGVSTSTSDDIFLEYLAETMIHLACTALHVLKNANLVQTVSSRCWTLQLKWFFVFHIS